MQPYILLVGPCHQTSKRCYVAPRMCISPFLVVIRSKIKCY